MIYFVFDVCGLDDVVEARWDLLQKRFGPWMTPDEALKQKKGCVRVLKQVRCKSEDHLKQVHASILAKGGEGTMLRQPRSFYQHGRSKSSFKVKDTYDGTATVVGYKAGEVSPAALCSVRLLTWPGPLRANTPVGPAL